MRARGRAAAAAARRVRFHLLCVLVAWWAAGAAAAAHAASASPPMPVPAPGPPALAAGTCPAPRGVVEAWESGAALDDVPPAMRDEVWQWMQCAWSGTPADPVPRGEEHVRHVRESSCDGEVVVPDTSEMPMHFETNPTDTSYDPHMDCTWRFYFDDPDECIVVHVEDMDVEADFDELMYQFRGQSEVVLSGPTSPFTVVSSSVQSELVMEFTSDGSVQHGGIRFTVDVAHGDECRAGSSSLPSCVSGRLTTRNGTIGSNLGQESYGLDMVCVWVIEPEHMEPDECIQLDFVSFATEPDFDYVEVYDGNSVRGDLIAERTGAFPAFTLHSTGGAIAVLFQSDAGISASGFVANFHITTDCGHVARVVSCEELTVLTDPVGVVDTNPTLPTYTPSVDCMWFIVPEVGPHECIRMDFERSDAEVVQDPFVVEDISLEDMSGDGSEILDSRSMWPGLAIFSSPGQGMRVRFRSDATLQYSGVRATYVVTAQCTYTGNICANHTTCGECVKVSACDWCDGECKQVGRCAEPSTHFCPGVEDAVLDFAEALGMAGLNTWHWKRNATRIEVCTSFFTMYLYCSPGHRLTRLVFHTFQPASLPPALSAVSTLRRLTVHNGHFGPTDRKKSGGLYGTIPPEYAAFTELEHLDLNGHPLLTGTVPKELFTKRVPMLRVKLGSGNFTVLPDYYFRAMDLDFSRNKVGGEISPLISMMREFTCTECGLVGTIPDVDYSLVTLSVGNNLLEGTIPEQLFSTKLEVLRLDHNRLTGSIPNTIANSTRLTELQLDDNMLEHMYTASIRHLSVLEYVLIANNRLQGTLGDNIMASNLQSLELENNALSGPLPASLFELGVLSHINLSNNQFSGVLPDTFPNAPFVDFSAAHNNIEGTVPTRTQWTAINSCDLSHNRLRGAVNLAVLSRELKVLDLSYNELDTLEPFPDLAVGLVPTYTDIRLNNNLLSGELPNFSILRRLRVLHMQHNDLEGELLGRLPLSLRNVNAAHNRFNGSVDQLRNFPELDAMDVSHNQLDGHLNQQYGVQSLLMSHNLITALNCLFIAPGLVVLDVSNNMIDELIAPQACYSSDSLLLLDLANNRIGGSEREFLARIDTLYPNLRTLDVSNNQVGLPLPEGLWVDSLDVLRARDAGFHVDDETDCNLDPADCLPSYMEPGPLAVNTVRRSCHVPVPANGGTLDLDWIDYSHGQLCRCTPGHYGIAGNCTICPLHAVCEGMDSQTLVYAQKGYWGPIVDVSTPEGRSKMCADPDFAFVRCQNDACLTTREEDGSWAYCKDGHTGRKCSECAPTYFAEGDACTKCPPPDLSRFVLAAVIIALVLFVVYVYRATSAAQGTVKILINYCQMLFIASNVGAPSFLSLSSTSSVVDVLNLSIPTLQCEDSSVDWISMFWMSVSTIPFAATVVASIWAIGRMSGRLRTDSARTQWLSTNIRAFSFLAFTKYLSLSNTVLSTLSLEPRDVCRDDVFFSFAPHLSATSPRGRAAHRMAIACVVLYVIGIPVMLGALTVWSRARGKLLAAFDFLYSPYRGNRWWWEAVVTLRRLFVSVAVAATPFDSPMLPFVLFIITLASSAVQRKFRPFRSTMDNRLEYVSTLVLAILLASLVLVMTDSISSYTHAVVGTLYMLLALSMLLAIVIALAKVRSEGLSRLSRMSSMRSPLLDVELAEATSEFETTSAANKEDRGDSDRE